MRAKVAGRVAEGCGELSGRQQLATAASATVMELPVDSTGLACWAGVLAVQRPSGRAHRPQQAVWLWVQWSIQLATSDRAPESK